MIEESENSILRTVYLPKSLDRRLRDLAFRAGKTKGDYILLLIQEAIKDKRSYGDEADKKVLITTCSPVKDQQKNYEAYIA